jgi:Trk-type K+ transport system membrane component
MPLWIQLLAATLLIILVTLIHGTGVVITTKLFKHEERHLKGRRLAFREFRLMVPMALCLFGLHIAEIYVFAAFFFAFAQVGTFADALYASAAAYTTLGIAEGALGDLKLIGAFEALAGFLLIGWSAAVFVTDMEKILRNWKP